jgi:hypothetical protein
MEETEYSNTEGTEGTEITINAEIAEHAELRGAGWPALRAGWIERKARSQTPSVMGRRL